MLKIYYKTNTYFIMYFSECYKVIMNIFFLFLVISPTTGLYLYTWYTCLIKFSWVYETYRLSRFQMVEWKSIFSLLSLRKAAKSLVCLPEGNICIWDQIFCPQWKSKPNLFGVVTQHTADYTMSIGHVFPFC